MLQRSLIESSALSMCLRCKVPIENGTGSLTWGHGEWSWLLCLGGRQPAAAAGRRDSAKRRPNHLHHGRLHRRPSYRSRQPSHGCRRPNHRLRSSRPSSASCRNRRHRGQDDVLRRHRGPFLRRDRADRRWALDRSRGTRQKERTPYCEKKEACSPSNEQPR